jgi:hypothetical protein
MDRKASRKTMIEGLSEYTKNIIYDNHKYFTERPNKKEQPYGVLYRWLLIPNTSSKAKVKIELYKKLIQINQELDAYMKDFVARNQDFFDNLYEGQIELAQEQDIRDELYEILDANTDKSQVTLLQAIKEELTED